MSSSKSPPRDATSPSSLPGPDDRTLRKEGTPERPDDAARAGSPARGILVIISSPSGAGKTTLARRLLGEFATLEFSVSYTTRAPRTGEEHGADYHFVSPDKFDRMVAAGELAEWAEVHGNRYGTGQKAIEDALVHGRDVLFDVDWQGGKSLGEAFPDDALKVFILPPDLATLEARLRKRGTDSDAVIGRRLARAIGEIEHHREYEYLIVNDDLDEAYRVLRAIYLLGRLARRPTRGMSDSAAGASEIEALQARIHRRPDSELRARADALVAQASAGLGKNEL